jgi:hypothetical protein
LIGCSEPGGWAELKIFDENHALMPGRECSDDSIPAKDEDMLEIARQIPTSGEWVSLCQGEIYGGVGEIDLPKKKGVYELKAEIYPPGFSEKQKEILAKNGIRVLLRPIAAPVVKIKVK